MRFKLEGMTIKTDDRIKWKLSRSFAENGDEFDVYQDGSTAFSLERHNDDPSLWKVCNGSPAADQYKDRSAYLSALATGTHERPVVASRRFESESLYQIFVWSIGEYIKNGWVTRDVFSDRLTTKKVKA